MSFKGIITDIASGNTKNKIKDATESFKQSLVAPIYKIPFGIGSTIKEIKDKRSGTYMSNVGTNKPAEETLESLLDAEIKVRDELSGLNKTLGEIKGILQDQANMFNQLLDDAEKHEDVSQNETSKATAVDSTENTGPLTKNKDGILTKAEKFFEGIFALEGITDIIGAVGGVGLLGALGSLAVGVGELGIAVAGAVGVWKLLKKANPSLPDFDPSVIIDPKNRIPALGGTYDPKKGMPKKGNLFTPGPAGALEEVPSDVDLAVPKTAGEFIGAREGFRGHTYDDVGHTAIGFGHDLTDAEMKSGKIELDSGIVDISKGLNKKQAVELLNEKDLPKYEAVAIKHIGEAWKTLTNNEKTAITDYVYNEGEGNSISVLKKIKGLGNNPSPDKVADILENGNARVGADEEALRPRRMKEANLARTPDSPEASFAAPPGLLDIKHPDAEYVPPKVEAGKKFYEMSKEKTEAAAAPIIVPVPTGGSSGGGVVPIPMGGGSSGPTISLGGSAPPNSVDINNMG
jgi:GH24 family phage-related lysozyme (muramidase)